MADSTVIAMQILLLTRSSRKQSMTETRKQTVNHNQRQINKEKETILKTTFLTLLK